MVDDDTADFVVVQSDGDTRVSEQGRTDEFTVVLDRAPLTGVVIAITPADSSEVSVFPPTIRFTNRNWDIPQTIAVSGVEDDIEDGTILSDVVISVVAESSDSSFGGVADQSITVTNFDNDGSTFLDDDRLVINATVNDDTITLTDNGDFVDVNINGVVEQFSSADFTQFRIIAGPGNDILDATATTKRVFARLMGGNDQFLGTLGDDTIQGGGGRDTVVGNGGDDNLSTGSGSDEIFGNDGADRLRGGNGRDLLEGDAGSDTVSGGGGADIINGGIDADQLSGGSGSDTISGGDGDDTLIGGQSPDSLIAGTGNDIVNGDGGADTISGGDGADLLIGHAGNDELNGDAGEDILLAGTTDATLTTEQLASVLAEWTSDRTYAQRVLNVRGAAGRTDDRLNTVFLTGPSGPETQTAFDDADIDTVSGGDADDLFFSALNDDLLDRLDGEWLETL